MTLGVGHEVRRQVALVELHTFGELELDTERVRLFDRDGAVLADLVDRVGNRLTDRRVGGRDGRDLSDLGLARDFLGLIGDGGDPSVGVGQIIQLYPNGTSGGAVIPGVTNPSGLTFDQAEQLYILDGTANTITVVPGPGSTQPVHLLQFDNSMLTAASGFASSAGAQSFVIANLAGPGSSNLVRLNGNRSTLAFGSVKVGSQSQPQTATVYNIGNLNMTLASPYYTTNGPNPAFSILGSTFCDNGNFLAPSWSCNIDVEFIPQVIGLTTQQLTVMSDGYNGGSSVGTSPVLVLRGTGAAGGSVKKKK